MTMPTIARRLIAGGAIATIVLIIAMWMLRPKVVDVDIGRVTRGPMRATVDEEGRTRVRDRYVVTAPVAGRLERIGLVEGQLVRAGSVVARLAPLPLDESTRQQSIARVASAEALAREAAARVQQATAAEQHSRRVAERRETLFAAGAISQEQRDAAALDHHASRDDLAAAIARAKAATADVDAARAALVSLDGGAGEPERAVRSPVSGSVLRVPERSERVVAAGAPLLELGDPKRIEIVVEMLSADAVRIQPGAVVEVAEWGGDKPLAGCVRTIEPSAFTKTSALGVDEQRVNVLVDLANPPATLSDGYRVETRTTVWESANALRVPASALFQRGVSWSVFVVQGGRARLRTVATGHRAADVVEVLGGLESDTEVVLFPSDEVKDGVRVRPRG